MVNALNDAQAWVVFLLGLAAFAMEIFAFAEALRYPAAAFAAAEKLTKNAWLGITGVALLLGFVSLNNPFGIGLLGVVAAGVFLADVRPAVRRFTPTKRKGTSGSGPYGSW